MKKELSDTKAIDDACDNKRVGTTVKQTQHAHDRTEIAGDTKTCIIVSEATEDDAMDAIIGGDLEQQREKKFHV